MRILNLHGIPFWMLCLPPSTTGALESDDKNDTKNNDHYCHNPEIISTVWLLNPE